MCLYLFSFFFFSYKIKTCSHPSDLRSSAAILTQQSPQKNYRQLIPPDALLPCSSVQEMLSHVKFFWVLFHGTEPDPVALASNCSFAHLLERTLLNQNQMSHLSSSKKYQGKLIAKPVSLSLAFPRTRIVIYLLLRYAAQLCKQWTLLTKLMNLQLIPRNCLTEKTELFLQS